MGYGSRALQALNSFYSGEYFNLDESVAPEKDYLDPVAIDHVSIPIYPIYNSSVTHVHVPHRSLMSKLVN